LLVSRDFQQSLNSSTSTKVTTSNSVQTEENVSVVSIVSKPWLLAVSKQQHIGKSHYFQQYPNWSIKPQLPALSKLWSVGSVNKSWLEAESKRDIKPQLLAVSKWGNVKIVNKPWLQETSKWEHQAKSPNFWYIIKNVMF